MCSREIFIISSLRIVNHHAWRFPGSKMPFLKRTLGPEVDVDRVAAYFLCPPSQAGGPFFRPLGKVPARKPQWTRVLTEPHVTGAGSPATECSLLFPAEETAAAPRPGQAAKVTNVDARGTRGQVRAPARPGPAQKGLGRGGAISTCLMLLNSDFPPYSPTSGLPRAVSSFPKSASFLRVTA